MVPDSPPTLPPAEALFQCFCAGWYPAERRQLEAPRLFTDLEEIELPPGVHISALSPLSPEGNQIAAEQIARMEEAALVDWQQVLGAAPPPGPAWLEPFENQYTASALLDLIRSSDPDRANNPWLVVACETGTLLAHLLRQQRPALQWLYDLPYWDSCLFDLNTRVRIPVFHWAFKRLSGDGMADRLEDKINATLAFIRDTESQPN